MGSRDGEKLLAGMSQASKKEFLDGLVISILHDMNETEKKELLRTVVVGQKENRQLSAMVEY
ncbi:MAG: hypothetical protein A2Z09_04450 [Nitrospirae bacterium RBG_16_43_8]|nr:MAG: hypothetical protein A2Z09_04450 [Nitrospirae bacterium RBG_16_43_8]